MFPTTLSSPRCPVLSVCPGSVQPCLPAANTQKPLARSWAAWSSRQPYPAASSMCFMFKQQNLPLLPCTSWLGRSRARATLQQLQLPALCFPGHFKSWIVAGLCLCPLEARSAFCWVFNLVDSMPVNCIIKVFSTKMMCLKCQDSQRRPNIRYGYETYLI